MSFVTHLLFNNTYTPPPVASTRRHSTGWSRCTKGYEPPPERVSMRGEAAERMFELVRDNPAITTQEIAKRMGRNVSNIYDLRDMLLEQDRIVGVRGKPPRRGGPTTTLFYVKEHHGSR